MEITFGFFNGFGLGIEYIGRNDDDGIDESVVIIDFACFRVIIWTGDFD